MFAEIDKSEKLKSRGNLFSEKHLHIIHHLYLNYFLGIKLINLRPLDPFFHPNQIKVFRDTGPVTVDAKVYKMLIHGLSSAKLKSFKGFDKDLLEINLISPNLTFSGPYQSKAKVLSMPFDNQGIFLVHMRK